MLIDNILARQSIVVDLGKFWESTAVNIGLDRYRVWDVVMSTSGFNNVEELALLRLTRCVPGFQVANICRFPVTHGAPLKTFGLGSTSAASLVLAGRLKEAHFVDSKYVRSWLVPTDVLLCPPNEICVQPMSPNTSICFMDEGTIVFVTKSTDVNIWRHGE
ncbi:uncharacterized protein LOC142357310 isoform X2 [Convolutriloba macropyga]|uniref:uncharacterized protein LOC142357310 isoform X2 n=2 Tax=Convolutriloba macropyga TaxID=536237 RepID=UPI003F521EB0